MKVEKQTYYTMKDGSKLQVYEALYDFDIKVYRADKKRAIVGDPRQCIIALGAHRHPQVVEAWVGSGKDAIVVLRGRGKRLLAWHFVIGTSARRVLDEFDNTRDAKSQTVTFLAPTKALTYAYRRKSNSRRREEIKNGSPVAHRGPRRENRMTRINIKHRPSAPVQATA